MSEQHRVTWLAQLIDHIEKDAFLRWHSNVRVISVFDEVRYDRSDVDLMSPAMRKYAVAALASCGCRQRRGHHVVTPSEHIAIWLPKPSVLGASSFDSTRYVKRRADDIYVLTPTQTAAYLLDHVPLEEAVASIDAMLSEQPINLAKLVDMTIDHPAKKSYNAAFPYLRYRQKQALKSPALRRKRALGSVF